MCFYQLWDWQVRLVRSCKLGGVIREAKFREQSQNIGPDTLICIIVKFMFQCIYPVQPDSECRVLTPTAPHLRAMHLIAITEERALTSFSAVRFHL